MIVVSLNWAPLTRAKVVKISECRSNRDRWIVTVIVAISSACDIKEGDQASRSELAFEQSKVTCSNLWRLLSNGLKWPDQSWGAPQRSATICCLPEAVNLIGQQPADGHENGGKSEERKRKQNRLPAIVLPASRRLDCTRNSI